MVRAREDGAVVTHRAYPVVLLQEDALDAGGRPGAGPPLAASSASTSARALSMVARSAACVVKRLECCLLRGRGRAHLRQPAGQGLERALLFGQHAARLLDLRDSRGGLLRSAGPSLN